MTSSNKINLFYPEEGGSKAYRIPALLNTSKGVLVASADARIDSQRDNPNKINNVTRFSLDDGKTWSDYQTNVSYPGFGLGGPAVIDTSLLEDETTQEVWMMYCHTPGGIGWEKSLDGTGFDKKGRKILIDHLQNKYYLGKDGFVYQSETDEKTKYYVDEQGYLFEEEVCIGTIYEPFSEIRPGMLFEHPTSFLQMISSKDGGKTWSKPMDLNPMVKKDWMRFIGSGPGIGIQLKYGKHQGRLVYPVYFTNHYRMFSCALIYSDDHGKTWQMGQSPNDNRDLMVVDYSAEDLGGTIHQKEITENQVVELKNGELILYMRNHAYKGCVAKAISRDGGETFSDFTFEEALVNPICQFSVLRYENEEDKDILLFCGPNSETERKNGTIRLSEDGGKTWPYALVIEKNEFIYSCMTQLKNGHLGILYETTVEVGSEKIKLVYEEISLEEIKKGSRH